MDFTEIEKTCMGCLEKMEAAAGVCGKCGFDNGAPEHPHQLPPMTVLAGKYLSGRVLGEGGFGITYLGLDLNLGIKVAIKEYYPSGFVTRTAETSTVAPYGGTSGDYFSAGLLKFLDEARSLARFHELDGIVEVRDFFRENGTAYIIMEFVEGQTLAGALISGGGRMDAGYVFWLIEPIILSLSNVHSSGLIHRDISPDNIMLAKDGRLKLLDFGSARQFDVKRTMSVMLKPGYAPAEQYISSGDLGPWTDVYALCATVYKLITGVMPMESLERLVEDTLLAPSGFGAQISPERERALMKGLAVKPEDRIRSMKALYAALYGNSDEAEEEEQEPTDGLEPVGFSERPKPLKNLNFLLVCSVTLLIAAIVMLVIYWPESAQWRASESTQLPAPTAAPSQEVRIAIPDFGLFSGIEGNYIDADEGCWYFYDNAGASVYANYIELLQYSIGAPAEVVEKDSAYLFDCGGRKIRLYYAGNQLSVFIPAADAPCIFDTPPVTQAMLDEKGLSVRNWLVSEGK